eukprot:scaffold13148_cov123-Skeletonema_marinoi.AAC.1
MAHYDEAHKLELAADLHRRRFNTRPNLLAESLAALLLLHDTSTREQGNHIIPSTWLLAIENMFGGGGNNYSSWKSSLSCRRKTSIEDSVIGNEWKDAQVVQSPSNSEETDVNSSIGDDEPSIIAMQQPHHLEDLYVMVGPQERVYPNNVAVDVDTELFTGKMLLMFRTPDVDDDDKQPSDNPIATFFKGKQRRFEFQWQFKLKQVPKGEVCFCAELGEPIEMGIIQRALTSTALRFVKKMNPGFSYYLSESHDRPSYLSFPVGTSMDRFTATKPGESNMPELGKDIVENKESMQQRKKGKKIEWNVDDVYTMSFSSMYLDFIEWKLMNFPGLKPFSVNTVAGIQPIKLTLYTHGMGCDELVGRKEEVHRNIVFSMEVSNANKSTLGKDANEWLAREKSKRSPSFSNIQLPEREEVHDEPAD